MATFKKITLFLLVFSFLCATAVFADDTSIREELNHLKARITVLEQRLQIQDKEIDSQQQCITDQNKKISEYESRISQFEVKLKRVPETTISLAEGVELGVGATMIVQGTDNVNNIASDVQKKKSRTDASYSADITLAKEFKEINGKAFLHLEGGQGDGLEDDLTLYSNVNRDADHHENVRVTELWYEQGLFKDKALLTYGKLDPTAYFDANEVANDETTQFLGRIFRNSPTIEFPDNTAGLRLAYIPTGWFELSYGLFNGNTDTWSKMFDNLFNIGQVRFMTNLFGLPGNYRLLGWNSNVYHTKWLNAAKDKEGTYGVGLSIDQKVTDIITAFARYAWQDPRFYNSDLATTAGDALYSLEHSWSTGFQVEGKPWGRENDVLGFAVGQAIPSDNYKKADLTRRAKSEGHIETYYKIQVNKHLALSPDFQYIWNPFGKDIAEDTKGVFVGGMRAQVDF